MKKLITAVILLMALPCFSFSAFAQHPDSGFTAAAVLPENQLDPQASHFDLQVAPGQRQELKITINNSENEDMLLAVETITASTSRGGALHYSSPGIYDESLRFPFSEIAVPEEKNVTVPANGSAETIIHLSVPEEGFPGIILGAIRILRQPNENELVGTGIVNQYSYVIGARLTQNPTEPVSPSFAMGTVDADLVNYKAAIVAPIRNTEPAIAKDLSVSAQIYPHGGDTAIIKKSQENISVAPNSVFPLTLVDQSGYGFAAGEYTAVIQLHTPGEDLEFRQDFTVTEQAAAQINDNAVNQEQNQIPVEPQGPLLPVVIIIGIIVVGFAAVWLRVRFRIKSRNAAK